MAGVTIPGSKYYQNGFYGTAQEHAARQQQQRQEQEASDAQARARQGYAAGQPSAGAAGSAATTIQNMNRDFDFSVDPTGRTNLSNQSLLARQAEEARAARDAAAKREEDARRSRDRQELLKLIQQTSQGRSAATISHPGAGGNEDARTAAFSRAKDQAGKIARASLTAIAEQMAGRGISGSGIEGLMEAGAIGGAGSSLIDVTRDQAISDAERAAKVNDLIYQGGIQQRGQDLSNRESYLALLRSIYSY